MARLVLVVKAGLPEGPRASRVENGGPFRAFGVHGPPRLLAHLILLSFEGLRMCAKRRLHAGGSEPLLGRPPVPAWLSALDGSRWCQTPLGGGRRVGPGGCAPFAEGDGNRLAADGRLTANSFLRSRSSASYASASRFVPLRRRTRVGTCALLLRDRHPEVGLTTHGEQRGTGARRTGLRGGGRRCETPASKNLGTQTKVSRPSGANRRRGHPVNGPSHE